MTLKKYIGVIVAILTLLGILNQRQADVHNQEIVLEFSKISQSGVSAEVAISVLKEELQHFGVADVKVVENANGKLKITYYSDADVSVIKRILVKKIRSELDTSDDDEETPFNLPSEEKNIAYHLDVHEIQKGSKTDSGLNGIEVLELKPKADRFFKPKTPSTKLNPLYGIKDVTLKVAFHLYKNKDFALRNALQQIPEVRAGPNC